MTSARPLLRRDGYLPLSDYGLIGDGRGCALFGLGLLPEQIDPADDSFLGNFPQAVSHVGVISSGVALTRVLQGGRPELSTRA